MAKILIKNALVVNEGDCSSKDILISGDRIERIDSSIDEAAEREIDASGLHLLPGAIDDQVHFREPGLTHKANIYSESRAAVAGGITSFMEMPNTSPPTTTLELLEEKYAAAANDSAANYSFYFGASNENSEEVAKVNPQTVCGVKIFMGSSTGNMLVDNRKALESIFNNSPTIIATHCEKEEIVKANLAQAIEKYGDDIPIEQHPIIRSHEACYASSSEAVALAKETGARLHVLHISTKEELELFRSELSLEEKKITCEGCIHHMWFSDEQYLKLGTHIKWNPAVKTAADRDAIRQAVVDGTIDVVATDHAPHTLEEKEQVYTKAPSGGPLVQHSLLAMLELSKQGVWSIELVVDKMCHAPAKLFEVAERGYIREGYKADLVLVDLDSDSLVTPESILYKCGWSPFLGHSFPAKIVETFVNGESAYRDGKVVEAVRGERLNFSRS